MDIVEGNVSIIIIKEFVDIHVNIMLFEKS